MLLNPILASLVTVLIGLTVFAPARAQGFDVDSANELLMRQLQEDFARQRARAQAQEAADDAKRNLPDYSQYGMPAEEPPARRVRPSKEMHCTTMSMGGGDSATDCF
jgi:hypothetical protein